MSGRSKHCLILAAAVAGCARLRPDGADPERDPAPHQDWWSEVRRSIAEEGLRAQPLGDGRFALSARDLFVTLDERGARARGPGVSWDFTLTSVRRDGGAAARLGPATTRAEGPRVVLARDGVDEWYVHGGTAVEQGFDVARLDGTGDLVVEGRVVSDRPATRIGDGLRYGALTLTGLRARDAAGRALRARFEATAEALAVRVDGDDLRNAVWPVVVDPVLLTSPIWEYSPLSSNVAGDPIGLGATVAGAGDVNCDGLGDVAVGLPGFEVNAGSPDIGRVYVFFGTPAGLTSTPGWQISAPPAALLAGARFGAAVAAAGDADGDGCSDLVVGAPGLPAVGQAESGRAYVYYGGAGGPGGPTEIIGQAQVASHFGSAVAGAGDVDGDGWSDVLVGAPDHDGGATDSGRAYLFRGGAAGVSTSFAWSATPSPQAGAHFGAAVAAAGDVDGDGAADFVAGAPDQDAGNGAAAVFLGVAAGVPSTTPDAVFPDASEVEPGARFGAALGSGDADGDGFSDVAVGAPESDDGAADAGRVFLYRGGAGGPGLPAAFAANPAPAASARFGAALAGAGDLDGDGLADFVAGSPGAGGTGEATLLLGDAGAALGAEAVPVPPQADAAIGSAVAAAGDVDGDGFGDVVVGAPAWDETGLDGGRAFGFYGGPVGLGAPAASPDASFNPEPEADAYFGWAVAGAGDVNADGYGDVVVGAPQYDFTFNDTGRAYVFLGGPAGLDTVPMWAQTPEPEAGARFGWSVAGAGTVDDDAFADLIVSARDRDVGGVPDAGKVYVFHGGPAGPSLSPDWEQDAPDPIDMGSFGASVAAAGMVNADVYADVIVGAPAAATTDAGRAYLFYGGPLGLGAAVTRLDAPETQAGAEFGAAVSGAGDVDGDGLCDVAVGAPGFDAFGGLFNHGRVYVYAGAPGGVGDVPSATLVQAQPGARFGAAVAGLGDADGDGYSDMAVGAPDLSAVANGAGRAMLFRGGILGLDTTPAWDVVVDPDASTHFGDAFAKAGDVNGDGLSDLVVGTQDAEAHAFFGGAAGPSLLPDWSATGAVNSNFGRALALADVTGDGFSDLAVGAASEATGGLLHVFLGGDDPGATPRLTQRDGADNPIRVGAISPTSDVTFEAVLANASWQGARIALEIELRRVGEPFLRTTTAAGVAVPTPTPARVSVGPLPAGSYRWRARAVWPATLGAGRWIDFGDNDPAEADFRVGWPLSFDNRGDPCSTNSECFSRFCRDGVCCASRCEGACQSCETGVCVGVETGPDPQCDNDACRTGGCSRGSCAVREGAPCGPCLACDEFGSCTVPVTVGGCGPDLGAPEMDLGGPEPAPDGAAAEPDTEPPPDAGDELPDGSGSETVDPFACDCSIGRPRPAPFGGAPSIATLALAAAWLSARRRRVRRLRSPK